MRQRLAELISYMDETRDRLFETARGVSPVFAGVKPRGETWSVENNMEHLAMVEAGVARLMVKSIEWAKANGVPAESSNESVMSSLDQYSLHTVTSRRKAPDMVTPLNDQPLDQSLAALTSSRSRLREALLGADGLDLCQVRRPHPVLGDIDMYQWALFVAQHEERHRRQIENTLNEVTELCAESAPIV